MHEIIDDEDSKKMSISAAEVVEGTTTAFKTSEDQDKVSLEGRLAKASRRQPQVMRFCPSLSTGEIDISVSGKTHFIVFVLIQLTI